MLSLKESIKLNNSFSCKLVFEKLEERNKKRMSQFSKRKAALSPKRKSEEKEIKKILYPSIDLTKKNEDKRDVINIFNLIINSYNNEINIEKKIIENFDNININLLPDTSKTKNNNNINKINNRPPNDNNDTLSNQIKNIQNITINNNTNINNTNEINKEINISNLEEKEKENLTHNIHKLNENNEFALKFLTSTNDSFIQLGNNLSTKLKIQKNYFTESYTQALGCDLENYYDNSNKISNNKIFENIETIKEEKEAETPLGAKNKPKLKYQNDILLEDKKIKQFKKNRKSKSLTKELLIINKKYKEKKIIDEIITPIQSRNKNKEKTLDNVLKKAKTKLQLFTNKKNSQKKKNKIIKIVNINNNDNIKKELNLPLTQNISNKKLNDILGNNKENQNKSVININNFFYNVNKQKSKFSQNKTISNYNIKNKSNQKKNAYTSKGSKNKNKYNKRKNFNYICIRGNKKNYNSSVGHSDEENNNYKNSNINNIKNSLNNNTHLKKSENKYNTIICNYCNKNLPKKLSINNTTLTMNDNSNEDSIKKMKKIEYNKLINKNNKYNHYYKNNNLTYYNKLSHKSDKINKSSIQSSLINKVIKTKKPLLNTIIKINNQNRNVLKYNTIFKKNISLYKNEEKEKETIKNIEEKKIIYRSSKGSSLNRTIFCNNFNLNQKKFTSNYFNFNKELLNEKNNTLNKSKLSNNCDSSSNIEQSKKNKSFNSHKDVNYLKEKK